MKIGVIGLKNKWSTEKLASAIGEKADFCKVIQLDEIVFDCSIGKAHHEGVDLSTYDGLVVKKLGEFYSPTLLDRLEILNYLHETRQVRVFSAPSSIQRIVNRLSCTLLLRQGGIPIPETTITENLDHALQAIEKYGKAVLKPLYTSKSRGMVVVEKGQDSLEQALRDYKKNYTTLYIQKFVDHPGQDLGVCFVGNQYIGTYARVAEEGVWNTSVRKSGGYGKVEPDQSIIDMSRKAQALTPLDFTCVDVVESPEGPKVFEISAFGGMRGLLESSGVDLATLYADYICQSLKEEDA